MTTLAAPMPTAAKARHPLPLTFEAIASAEQRPRRRGAIGLAYDLVQERGHSSPLARSPWANLCELLRVQSFAQFQRAHPKVF
jgi:hypothetical protein